MTDVTRPVVGRPHHAPGYGPEIKEPEFKP